MRPTPAPTTVVRVASIIAVVLVLVGVVFWRSKASSSGDATADVVVSAGTSQGDEIPSAAAAGPAAKPAVAISAELPLLEPATPAAVLSAAIATPKAPAVTPDAGYRDDSLALAKAESSVTPTGDAEIGSIDAESSGAGTKEPPPEPQQPTLGQMYTWEDGDRTLEVWRDPNLVVEPDSDGVSREDIIASTGDGVVVRGDAKESLPAKGDPVFWSSSGELMALPGGAVLVLNPSWDTAAVDEFLERNGINASRLTELDYVANGFFIETEPGFPSLNLANSLAGQDGVELASPNWWIERVTR